MSCRDCQKRTYCYTLTRAIEDWDESKEEEAISQTGAVIEDIEDRLPATCGAFALRERDEEDSE